jgi:hypothetical protein
MRYGASAGAMRRCCYAFDLIEHDGDDLRDLPLMEASGGSPDCSAGPSAAPSSSPSI